MDINKGLLYCSNNDELFRQNLVDFYKDSLRRQETVRNLAQTNIEQYKIEVHALKGFARNIGAIRLSEMAYLHEAAVTDGELTYVGEHLEQLLKLWSQTMKEIEDYVGAEALGDELAIEDDGVEIPPSEIVAAAKLCILHLQKYEEEQALQVLKRVLTHKLPEETREIFKQAYRETDDFEYDSAIALLENLT